MGKKVLQVKNLVTQFSTNQGIITAIDHISFDLYKGKSLGIVGESGSGKSATALSLMRLITSPGKISGEGIFLNGRDILKLSESEMRTIRGNKIAMIFQEPMTSLNPVYNIGSQIIESIILHQNLSMKAAKNRCLELLSLVGIPAPMRCINEYPHQLSGGMKQRVMIAMALSCDPDVLIADEPTTALDVTTQAQILDLISKLQRETQMSIILITHDLGLVTEICDDVAVMYCGRIVEKAPVKILFAQPMHHYTKGLLDAIPPLGVSDTKLKRLYTIDGMVPSLAELPIGCNFQYRCPRADDFCKGMCGDRMHEEIEPLHFVECVHPLQYNNSNESE